ERIVVPPIFAVALRPPPRGPPAGGRRRCIARPAVDSGCRSGSAPCVDRFGAGSPAADREPFQPTGFLSPRPEHRLRARHYHKNFALLLPQYYTKKLPGSKGQALDRARRAIMVAVSTGGNLHDGIPACKSRTRLAR